jgi:hypothetical protein
MMQSDAVRMMAPVGMIGFQAHQKQGYSDSDEKQWPGFRPSGQEKHDKGTYDGAKQENEQRQKRIDK